MQGKSDNTKSSKSDNIDSVSVYKDEEGNTCIGNGCVRIKMLPDRVKIIADEELCTEEETKAVKELRRTMADTGRTEYEFRKKIKD